MAEDETDIQEPLEDMGPEYSEEEAIAVHSRFTKIIAAVGTAQIFGLLACFTVWREYPEADEVQSVMMTSGMIFAIGLAMAVVSYGMFRTSVGISRDAAVMRREAGEDRARLLMARERQDDAVKRAQSGFKPLNFSGACFAASALIGISGLLSI
ncbi:MAG: hypothetical protein HOM25_19160 [Rhodospirillaceae bacterium]|jgi:hypothetical protein|nr:hypothetical protein [Rhodospirillaceae bacterium]MBT5665068.1 hypothetical protein [Rhodospirillaceae bacterium]